MNQNMSITQKEFLLWHWKLGVIIYYIKSFIRPGIFEETNGNITILPDIINPKFTAARNCSVPALESCMLAISKKRSTNTKEEKTLKKKEGYLSRDKIEFGDLFQMINLFVRLLVVYILVTGESQVIVIFKEALFIIMLLLVWFGLKIKTL